MELDNATKKMLNVKTINKNENTKNSEQKALQMKFLYGFYAMLDYEKPTEKIKTK